MAETFYFLRVNGIDGRTFATKRAACRMAKRMAVSPLARSMSPAPRITVWLRDCIGQHIPVNWRAAR